MTTSSRTDVWPAAPTQQRLWMISKLFPGSTSYNITSSMELRGQLDRTALRAAVAELCERHAALRTTFDEVGGELRQRVDEDHEPRIEEVDCRSCPDPYGEASRRAHSTSGQPIDLEQGPVFKVLLCQVADDVHVVSLFMHHILADAWSMGVVWEDLGLLYGRRCGNAVTLPPAGLPYVEFARDKRAAASGDAAAAELSRWLDRLRGVEIDNSLRTDRPRPLTPSFRGKTCDLAIPAPLVRRLQRLARSQRATLFMALTAGFAVDLAHYDGREDVVIATQVAGRADPRVQRTVGFFVNTLPLRLEFDASSTMLDALRTAREATLEAYGSEHVTYEQLLAELGSLGDTSMNPLAQVAFQLLNVPMPEVSFGDLATRRWWDTSRAAKFDLSVMLVPEREHEGLRAFVTYADDLFEQDTVTELWQGYIQALEVMADDPSRPLYGISLVDAAQRDLVAGWSRGTPAASDGTLLDRLEELSRTSADRTAIVAGEERTTYSELWRRSGAVAASLVAHGVGADGVVAVSAPRRRDTVVAVLGSWRAGATAVVMDGSDASVRVAERAGATHAVRAAGCDAVGGLTMVDLPEPDAGPRTDPPRRPAPVHGYVVATSGSAGSPRVVRARLDAFEAYVLREARALGPDRRTIQVPPLSFDPGMRDVFVTLAAGATLVIPRDVESNPVDAVADAIATGAGDTLLAIVPSILDAVMTQLVSKGRAAKLALVRCCGEPLPARVANRARDVLGRVPVNDYGPSECTMVSASSAMRPVAVAVDSSASAETSIVPIGGPTPNTDLWVLSRGGQLVRPGFTGEIHVAGPHVAEGYVDDPAATAERFAAHPFGGPSRVHRTGDLGYYDSRGVLHWIGRKDRQVKVRGVRISLQDVEEALLACDGVLDAAAVVQGELAERALVGFVAGGERALDVVGIRSHLRAVLPRAAVPSAVEQLARIPRSDRGKLMPHLLPQRSPTARVDLVEPPATDVECTVAAVWAELLDTPDISRHDDFFDLGGNSIAAMQAASRLTASLGREVSVTDIFEHPTIAQLGRRCAEAVPARAGERNP